MRVKILQRILLQHSRQLVAIASDLVPTVKNFYNAYSSMYPWSSGLTAE